MARVPEAWTLLVDQHRAAQVAHDRMHRRDLPQTQRDEATIAHGRALDQMFAAMNRMSEQMLTGRITVALARGRVQ